MTQGPHFNFHELPPEIQEQMLAEQARQQMSADDYRHSVLRMFEEAAYEHLIVIRSMLHNMTFSARPDIFSAFYEGQVGMVLQRRFNICPSCSVDHDKELTEDHPSEQGGNSPESPDQPIEELTNSGKVFVNVYKDLTEADINHMEAYGLDDLRNEEDNNKLVGFVCLNCGMQYSSIEDRMRDESGPGGCSGCRQKAKWG